jgi:hypothetical protein
MRTLIMAVLMWLVYVPSASACDICGCSIGGNYLGILPQFHRHFVGLRYSEQAFRSAHSRSEAEAGHYVSSELYHTTDLLARFYPARRIQVLTLLPYHDFQRREAAETLHTRGLGDLSLLGNFLLIDDRGKRQHRWQQTLSIGGGIKLPTGQHRLEKADGTRVHPNMQPGTGTVDFALSLTYTLRRGAFGIMTDAQARFNTRNREWDLQQGNRYNAAFKFFYWKNSGKVMLLPNLGIFADRVRKNQGDFDYTFGTGGNLVLATAGLDLYFGKISIGATWQQPLWQDLGQGKVQNRYRWTTTLNYLF